MHNRFGWICLDIGIKAGGDAGCCQAGKGAVDNAGRHHAGIRDDKGRLMTVCGKHRTNLVQQPLAKTDGRRCIKCEGRDHAGLSIGTSLSRFPCCATQAA